MEVRKEIQDLAEQIAKLSVEDQREIEHLVDELNEESAHKAIREFAKRLKAYKGPLLLDLL